MRLGVLAGLVALTSVLGACDKLNSPAASDCTSADATSVVGSIVSDQILKATKAQISGADGKPLASDSKIRATIDLIKISIGDIRTTKSDPNSTKKFCEGTLKVVMPLGMISDAEKAHEAMDLPSMAVLAEGSGIERSADTFSHEIEFSIQPTDDKKKIFGEIEGFGEQFSFIGEVVASHLALPVLQSQQSALAAQLAVNEAEVSQQAAAQSQADLDMATAENNLANQSIGEIWNAIADDARSELLPLQRAWIKKKTADCNIKAAESSTEKAAREAARLRCDTEKTNERANELRAYL